MVTFMPLTQRVVFHILGNFKPALAGKVADDDRNGTIQREARIAVRHARRQNRADQVAVPAEAGAQHQLAIAGQELQDFDEVDRQRQRDRADGIVEEPIEIGLDQRPLAELGESFLLLGPAAQLIFEIGDIFPHRMVGRDLLRRSRLRFDFIGLILSGMSMP